MAQVGQGLGCLLVMALCLPTLAWTRYAQKLLLVSMDGFRWDYLNRDVTPTLSRMATTGVKAPYVNNTFVTVSFPDHYSMVTGLYQESHGLVGNNMYDSETGAWFNLSTTRATWWEGARPLWVTARQAGRGVGLLSWPGAEVAIHGVRPSQWVGYNQPSSYVHRVQQAVEWLSPLGQDLDLVLLYFDEPDATGHHFGPDSPEVTSKLAEMDAHMDDLWRRLEKAQLDVNVIITSDHGMANVDMRHKVVKLGDYINLSWLEILPPDEVVVGVLPAVGRERDVWNGLQQVPHVQVFRKGDIPERFHYKHGKHVLPITLIAEEGWMITANMSLLEEWNPKGTHGYDNTLQSMKPIFLAKGPNFKENFSLEPIASVDIYPLVCELLGLVPEPHNGSLARVLPAILKSHTNSARGTMNATWRMEHLLVAFTAVVCVILCIES